MERKPLQNFNLDTMSGIFPGSRTMTYQRLRLRDDSVKGSSWYQLQWYRNPDAAVLLELQADNATPSPRFTLPDPQQETFTHRFYTALAANSLEADACFACRNWQPVNAQTEDGLPVGRCRWSDAEGELPDALATQSALSLACDHFLRLETPKAVPQPTSSPNTTSPRVPTSAELDPDRLPFWPRLWHRVRHGSRHDSRSTPHWTEQIIERSGVGAGTEPCFVCQGRLANLGALAVASPEGDKQTLSVWRCRSCFTTYFNDWTDRWERLDNLETEEAYYRVAPAEAYAALQIIHNTKGGEHPGRRHDRTKQRRQMMALISGKEPLSHQVRQGR